MPERSFQDYVTSRFEDEIFQAVEKFVFANRLKPEFTTNKISYPSSTVLDRIWIKSVTVNDLPKMEIEFIVTVEAQIDLQVVRGQWDDFDECFPWIQLKCRGDLDQNLDDFEVTGIRIFDKSKPAPRPLIPCCWHSGWGLLCCGERSARTILFSGKSFLLTAIQNFMILRKNRWSRSMYRQKQSWLTRRRIF